jgi:cyclopropane fatty-acyl-phospholipid synthase-like methyltransferase
MTENRLATRDAAYFEELYAVNPDPWNFTASAYEHEKYAATLAMLGQRQFARGLEVGCSIGVLTKLLAGQCEQLLAVDIVEKAVAQAKARCAGVPHVTFECAQVPQNWPVGKFDLIVLSEILYFLHPTDIARMAALANASLVEGGVILLVNYTEDIDEPCSGREAAEIFGRSVLPDISRVNHLCRKSFRIDLFIKHHSDG